MAGRDHPGHAVSQGRDGTEGDSKMPGGKCSSNTHGQSIAGIFGQVKGACDIQLDTYTKEYSMIHLKGKPSTVSFKSNITVPEWIHIKEMEKLRIKLQRDLQEFQFNFKSPKDISVQYDGYWTQIMKDKLHEAFTAIQRTLLIQPYRIPTEYHDTALKKLHESDAFKNKKGTYWKSHDGVFVFVVDKETKDGLHEFVSIICSLPKSDIRTEENHQPDVEADHKLQREARAMGEDASPIPSNFKDVLKPCELKALGRRDKIGMFVSRHFEEKGISCSFDLQAGKVEFSSEEKLLQKIKCNFHSLFNEVSKSMTTCLKAFNLEEIRDTIYASLGSESELVVILPEEDHVITIFGIAEFVNKAENMLTRFMKDFQNADFHPFKVPGEKFSTTLWQEVTDIADKQGRVKVMPYDYDPSSLWAFGRKECVDELQRMVMTKCSQEKIYPIMEPQLSLLTAKSDVVSYLTEEAMRKNIQLEVDLGNKRYSIVFKCDQKNEVDHFLQDWCKTEELKDVQGTEKTKEKIDAYLKTCGSEIYSRLLLKVNGSTIHLITTAKDFDRVTECIEKWRKSHLNTDSYSAGAGAATDDSDDDEEQITKSAVGTIRLKCKLHYPLTEYCSKTNYFRQLVVDEFKTHGFEIQIDKDCKKASFTLSNIKDKAKVKHILNSFGAQQFDLADYECCLTARELKKGLVKENPSVSDKAIQIYVPADKNIVMIFGLKWQLDALCHQAKEMLDNFELQTFSISLASHLEEKEVKRNLERETNKMQPLKIVFENKEMTVQIAKSNLDAFRTVVYDLLEQMGENNQQEDFFKASLSVSERMLDFLQRAKINKKLKEKFKDKNLSFFVEKRVRFRALSYSSLKQADLLFKACVIVKKYNLQSKPIGIMLQGEDLTRIFEPREELLVFVDDAQVLNVICLSHVLQQVEQELHDKSDEYDEDSIRVSIEDLEMKMTSEKLTSELFELDKALMGQVKVLVDGESVRIVAKRDLLPNARMKVDLILQRIETEEEINYQNPCHVVKLDELQVRLLEKPGILANLNRKMEEQHFQVLYDFKGDQVKIYGLTKNFAQSGKSLFESIFKRIELPIAKDSILRDHDLDALKEMVNDQLNDRMDTVVVDTDPAKATLIFVCISDDYAYVTDIIEEMTFVGAEVVQRREEIIVYIERFLAEKLNKICGNNVFIKTELKGLQSELKITGPKKKMLQARAEIEGLCSMVAIYQREADKNVSACLKTHLSEIEAQLQCVIRVNDQGSARETYDNPTIHEKDLLRVELADLSKLKTDVIAVMFAEQKLPSMIESFVKRAGVFDNWTNMAKSSSVMSSVAENVIFGEKKLLNCKHLGLCKMPHWTSQDQSREKEAVRNRTQCLLQNCMRMEVSEVSIVIAVENKSLFRRIAKQVIFEVMKTLKENHETFSLRVNLVTWDHDRTSKLREILRDACKDTDGAKPKASLTDMIMGTLKGNKSKRTPRSSQTPEILLDLKELETKKIDVLVNSVSTDLNMKKGSLAKALNVKTGGRLETECKKKHKGIKYGEVIETKSCGLLCNKVLHGALIPFEDDEKGQTDKRWKWKMMKTFIRKCLKMASNDESIAFPALGTGNLKYPPQEAAAVMVDEIQNFFNQNPSSKLKTVEIVLHPHQKEIIKVFTDELMSHYQKITGLHQLVIRSDGFPVQILEGNGPCNFTGSNQILCFWDSETLKDVTKHPVLGKAEELLETWKEIEEHLKNKKVHTGRFPSIFKGKTILSFLVDDKSFGDNLAKALTMAINSGCTVLHVPLTDERDGDFVKLLKVHLLKSLKQISQTSLQIIRIVTRDAMFEDLSSHFQQEILNSSTSDVAGAQASAAMVSSQAQDGELASGTTNIVIAAKSEDICKEVLKRVQQEALSKVSKFPSIEGHFGEEDAWGYTHVSTVPEFRDRQTLLLNCNAFLNPACLQIHDWKSVQKLLRDNYNMMVVEKKDSCQVQCTNIDDFIHGYDHLHKFWTSMNGKSSGQSSVLKRKRTGRSTTISEGMLRAVQHLIGEQFDACCDVEVDISGSRRVFFVDNENASAVEQRIPGIIQEEESAKDADKERANKVAEQAMKEFMNVYIEYQPEKHTMLLFAEDWTVMDKARKKVASLLGQSKVSSRGARRFMNVPNEPNTPVPSPVESVEMSFDYDKGDAKGAHINVSVYKANITDLPVDAIVNAANGHLSHGGGVARAISSAAGQQMTTESHEYCRKFGEIKVSEIGITSCGKLPCKMVFHAVGPHWEDYENKSECLEDLCRTILRCLCEADHWGISSIAMPSISAAIFKVPKDKCAAMYVRALKSFDKIIKKTCLTEVHFVDITDDMVLRIRGELKAKWLVPPDSSELAKDSSFIQHCLSSRPAHSVGIAPIAKSSSKSLKLDNGKQSVGAGPQSGPGEELKEKFQFNEKVSVTVRKDNIFKVEANALVSWEELGSTPLQPLPKCLVSEGGKKYEDERKRKLDKSKKGDIVPTTSGNLIQNQVVHAFVGMMTSLEDFVKLVAKLLSQCVSWNYTSVLLPVFLNFSSTVKGKKPVNLFVETVVDALTKLSEDKTRPMLRVIIVDQEERVVQNLSSALSQYLISLGLAQNTDKNIQGDKDCPICFEKMTDPERLSCGHAFCKECLEQAFDTKKACPVCGKLYGPIFGTMPKAEMRNKTLSSSLPGFPGCGTIVINYNIPSGIQTEEHPNPGKPFVGAYWTAYLPDTYEGRKVLALLRVAFERRLTFTVGRSVSHGGNKDRVTWNEIHHKTKLTGGSTGFGYPDETYLQRVQEELKQKGITEKDLETAID